MRGTDRQKLYGLVVEAPFQLHQNRVAGPDAQPDVAVTVGPPLASNEDMPEGRPVIDYAAEGRRWYSATQGDGGGYRLRFHGTCDFTLSPDLARVSLSMVDGVAPGIGEVLTTGAMLAFQLYLRGYAVLHGSAVQVGGGALGFVGSSGQGKSTMATLQCADGAALITDDVLRVDADPTGAPVARLGATELRLRKGADLLASRFTSDRLGARVSADERQILRLPDDADDRLPLRALVIPVPDKAGGPLRVTQIPRSEAVFAMLTFGRLNGWADQDVMGEHFKHVTELTSRVPVFVAQVPWGPPFSESVAAELRSAVLGEDPL